MAIKGADKHLRRLQGMQGAAAEEARKLVYTLADMHVDKAAHLITQGSVSGANHVASKPGEPPNNDTGVLARSGHVREAGPLKADSVFDAPYAAAQEFGAVIEHPGGTPYFIGKDGKAVFVSKQGAGAHHALPVTKPHTIILKERPYARPAAKIVRKAVDKLAKAAVKIIVSGKKL